MSATPPSAPLSGRRNAGRAPPQSDEAAAHVALAELAAAVLADNQEAGVDAGAEAAPSSQSRRNTAAAKGKERWSGASISGCINAGGNLEQWFEVDHPVMQRMVVFFLFAEGASCREIARRLKVIYGKMSIERGCVNTWANRFADGARSVLDRRRAGRRAHVSSDADNMRRVGDVIERCGDTVPIRQIARECGLSQSTAHRMRRRHIDERDAATAAAHGDVAAAAASEKDRRCDLCMMLFSCKESLKRHMFAKHIGDQAPSTSGAASQAANAPCATAGGEQCESPRGRPIVHVSARHRHRCEHCDRTFGTRHALLGHMNRHKGRKLTKIMKHCGGTHHTDPPGEAPQAPQSAGDDHCDGSGWQVEPHGGVASTVSVALKRDLDNARMRRQLCANQIDTMPIDAIDDT